MNMRGSCKENARNMNRKWKEMSWKQKGHVEKNGMKGKWKEQERDMKENEKKWKELKGKRTEDKRRIKKWKANENPRGKNLCLVIFSHSIWGNLEYRLPRFLRTCSKIGGRRPKNLYFKLRFFLEPHALFLVPVRRHQSYWIHFVNPSKKQFFASKSRFQAFIASPCLWHYANHYTSFKIFFQGVLWYRFVFLGVL